MSILHVVSVAGGKDSAATLPLALMRFGSANVVPIWAKPLAIALSVATGELS